MIKKIFHYYDQIRVELKWWLILLLIVLLLFPALLTTGHIVLWDLDFWFTLRWYIDRILPLWNKTWSTGTFFNGTRLPFVLVIYSFVLLIWDHPSLFEKLLIFSLVYWSAVAMYYLVFYIIKSYCDRSNLSDNYIVSIAVMASIYYAFNPWSIIRIQHIYLLVWYAVLPAIFYQILQFSWDLLLPLKYNKNLRSIFIHIVLASTFYVVAIWAVHYLFFTAFLFVWRYLFLVSILLRRRHYRLIWILTYRYAIFWLTFLLLVSYWLIPYLWSSLIASVNPPSINTMDSINMLSRFSTLTNVLYLNSYWWSMMDINSIGIFFWIWWLFILLIMLIWNIFNIKNKITGFFIAWSIVFVILSTGSKLPLFATMYKWIVFDNALAGKVWFIFRDSNKLVWLVAFWFAILLWTWITWIIWYLKDKISRRWMELMYLWLWFDKVRKTRFNYYKTFIIIFSITTIGSYLAYLYPFYSLYLNHFYTNTIIPSDYTKFINYQKNDLDKTKYFYLPRYETILTPGFEYAVTNWNLTTNPQKPVWPYDLVTSLKDTYNPLEWSNMALSNFYSYVDIYLKKWVGSNLKSYFDMFWIWKIVYGMDLYKLENESKIVLNNIYKQWFTKENILWYVNIFKNKSAYWYAHYYKNSIYNFLWITSFETVVNNKIVNPSTYSNIFVNADIETSKWNFNDKKWDIFIANNRLDLILSNINKSDLIAPFDYNNYSDSFSRWAKNSEYSPDWQYHLRKNWISNYSWDFSLNKWFIFTYAPAMLDVEPYEDMTNKWIDLMNFDKAVDTWDLFTVSDKSNLKIWLDKKDKWTEISEVKWEVARWTSEIWKVWSSKIMSIKEQNAYIFDIVVSGKNVNNIHGKVKFFDKNQNELWVSYVSAPRSVDNFDMIKFSWTFITPIWARAMIFELNTLTNPTTKSYWWIHDIKIKDMKQYTKENIQTINYKINKTWKYKVFTRTFDNIAWWDLLFKVNNKSYNLKTKTDKLSKFTWHYLWDISINKIGNQEISIRNVWWFNAVNVIWIVRENEYKILEDQIINIHADQYVSLEAETDGKIDWNIQSNTITPNSNGKSVNLNYWKTEYEFDILKPWKYNIKLLYNKLATADVWIVDINIKFWNQIIFKKNKTITADVEYLNNINLVKWHYVISIWLKDTRPSLIKTEDLNRFSYDDWSNKDTLFIKEDSSVTEKRLNNTEPVKEKSDKKVEYLTDEPWCSYYQWLLDDYISYDYFNDWVIYKKNISLKSWNSCFWLITSNHPKPIKPNTEYLLSYFLKKIDTKQFHSKIIFYDKNMKTIFNSPLIVNWESRTTNQLESYEYSFENNMKYYKDYIIQTPKDAGYISVQFWQKQRQDVKSAVEISNILFKEYNTLPWLDSVSIIDNRIRKNWINSDLEYTKNWSMENILDVSKIKSDWVITIWETYTPLWQANIDNEFVKPIMTNFFLNWYYFKKSLSDELVIKFLPKKFVFPAFSITILAMIIIVLILMHIKWLLRIRKKLSKTD